MKKKKTIKLTRNRWTTMMTTRTRMRWNRREVVVVVWMDWHVIVIIVVNILNIYLFCSILIEWIPMFCLYSFFNRDAKMHICIYHCSWCCLCILLMIFLFLPISPAMIRNIVTIENVYKIGGKEIDQQSKNYTGNRDTNNWRSIWRRTNINTSNIDH